MGRPTRFYGEAAHLLDEGQQLGVLLLEDLGQDLLVLGLPARPRPPMHPLAQTWLIRSKPLLIRTHQRPFRVVHFRSWLPVWEPPKHACLFGTNQSVQGTMCVHVWRSTCVHVWTSRCVQMRASTWGLKCGERGGAHWSSSGREGAVLASSQAMMASFSNLPVYFRRGSSYCLYSTIPGAFLT